MLPLVKPAIAATATVQFLDAWNSYLDPLVFISNWKKWTIPLALNQFVGTEVTQYNLTMAACCLAVVPVFIVFLCGQRVLPERLVRRCRQRLINQTEKWQMQCGRTGEDLICLPVLQYGAAKLGRGEQYVSTSVKTRQYEVVVVGGGLAGVCAAIASARKGARTAIVQNRSMFGGNASSEIRMHIVGSQLPTDAKKNLGETGILLENLTGKHKRQESLCVLSGIRFRHLGKSAFSGESGILI